MRYLIRFSYDGTKFHGFQRQSRLKSVQGSIEDALCKVLNELVLIKGSGRTDAGVHALNQAAHFDTTKKINKKLIREVNDILNEEIIIKSYKLVDDGFHARYNVKKKIYVYKIYNSRKKAEYNGYYYQISYPLDMKKMKEASKILIGTHNYKRFVSGYRDDYESTIFSIKIKKKKNTITLEFSGIGFYRYMVRHLVGALVEVGKGKVTKEYLKEMLDNPDDKHMLSVVPAEGLYLKDVIY